MTKSNMLDLGIEAPDFNLPDVISDSNKSFNDIKGPKGTLVIFMCNHCPYVIHVLKEMVDLAHQYEVKGISAVAISSNDVKNYPADSPEKMKSLAQEMEFEFPYLYDASQEVAKAYDAACTPDFYLFDENHLLVYRGRMDDSRPGNDQPVTGNDLRAAMDAMLDNKDMPTPQYPSMGCNIKWK